MFVSTVKEGGWVGTPVDLTELIMDLMMGTGYNGSYGESSWLMGQTQHMFPEAELQGGQLCSSVYTPQQNGSFWLVEAIYCPMSVVNLFT